MTKRFFSSGKAQKTELCLSIVRIFSTQSGEKRGSYSLLILLNYYSQEQLISLFN